MCGHLDAKHYELYLQFLKSKTTLKLLLYFNVSWNPLSFLVIGSLSNKIAALVIVTLTRCSLKSDHVYTYLYQLAPPTMAGVQGEAVLTKTVYWARQYKLGP